MKLTPRRARKARAWVEANRCTVGPGIVHEWGFDGLFDVGCDYTRGTEPKPGYSCRKCLVTDWPS